MRRVSARAVVCIGLAFGSARGLAGDRRAAPELPGPAVGTPVAAVWEAHSVNFVYRGRTARYSCSALRDKVRAMLLDLGARRDPNLTVIACRRDDRLRIDSGRPSLHIVFSAPALPKRAAKDARLGGLAATAARFEAFTVASDTFRNMGLGDCELVDEFARQILPKFATQEVREDIDCVSAAASGHRFLIHGKILRSLP